MPQLTAVSKAFHFTSGVSSSAIAALWGVET